jgi:Flp pilus assembly protein TadD
LVGLAVMGVLLGIEWEWRETAVVEAAATGVKVVEAGTVTWRGQIAPILYRNCTSCHHVGGSAPFALMTYQDARRWAGLMKSVTASRYMPPWLPEPGHGEFADSRRLGDAEIALVRAWVDGGRSEGDGKAPAAPVYSGDWALGTPDLVVEMDSPMKVPAGGTDLFMNFALPVPVTQTRWVRAMEIKPGSPQLVHHANVILDRTASLRRAHPGTWQAGVPGMDIVVDSGENFEPDSHFLFWKPDSTALVEAKGMPWRLDPGNDLVLNMHLKPTGKEEQVKARIGLYFTEKAAVEHPMLLELEHDDALDIPAGDAAFVVEDSLKLPVAVEVLGVYPHAHYLGKRMEGWATLPDGEKRWLVLIADWDIERQAVYRYAKPVELPKGSVVHMRYTYDNSAGNARNPNSPPIRVKAGNRSVDEMGHLWLQVLPVEAPGGADGRRALEQAWMENRLGKDPKDGVALYNLASLAMMEGDGARASGLFKEALAVRPGDARTMTSVGSALELAGDWRDAQTEYKAAIAADASYADAVFDLGGLDLRHEELGEAETLFRGLTAAHPEDAEALAELGTTLEAEGKTDEAKTAFEQALARAPENFEALVGLGKLAVESGDAQGAELLLVRALAVKKDGEGERLLALAYASGGSADKALEHLKAWQALAPKDAEPHRALAQVYGSLGRGSEAIREQREVVTLEPSNAGDWNDLGVLEARAGDRVAARREFDRALAIEPGNEAAKANLKKL